MRRVSGEFMAASLLSGLLIGCNGYKPPTKFPEIPEFVGKPLVRNFEKQARGLSQEQWQAIYAKHIANPKIPVRVVVVDFVPDKTEPEVRSIHSFAVTRVIGSLFCGDAQSPECDKRVGTNPVRSMEGRKPESPSDYERTKDDHKSGVDFLTFAELRDRLSDVLAQASHDEHLVINIATAWDPIKADANDSTIKSILGLLRRASCMGAIVVSPAGNVTGTDGPLFPAAYESEKAPTVDECAALKLPRRATSTEAYAPLVYAVGSLDALDQRLASMRRWSQPRIAAYGHSITAPGAAGMQSSPIISGTSASAAVVSGIAAAVWSARPELDAHQVMALVYQGGVELDGAYASKRAQTEFCLGQANGPCRQWPVRRAFMCGALAKALPDEKLGCVDTPSTSAEQPQLPPELRLVDPPRAEACNVTGCKVPAGTLAVQIPGGAVPQPGILGCPGCTLDRTQTLMWGKVSWLPTSPYDTGPPPLTSTLVRTFSGNGQQTDFQFAASDLKMENYFNVVMVPPSGTYAAKLILSIDVGYLITKEFDLIMY